MRLLLLSNSTNAGEPYLSHGRPWIERFLQDHRRALFVPYALVPRPGQETADWTAYTDKVRAALPALEVRGAHEFEAPAEALKELDAVLVGGGNTFHLVRALYTTGLMEAIGEKVRGGTPYVGWSAGSNVAGPALATTNDMPIVEPPSHATLGLVPFQINPHFTDAHPPGHQGETRRDRIGEFTRAHPEARVVALPEGTALKVEHGEAVVLGPRPALVFQGEGAPREVAPTTALPA